MRVALFISALAGLAAAAPRPQDMDFEEISVSSTIAYINSCYGLTRSKERTSTQQDRTITGGAERPSRLQPGSCCSFSLCSSYV